MAMTYGVMERLERELNKNPYQIIVFTFAGMPNEGRALYPNKAPFYVWRIDSKSGKIDVAPIPITAKKKFSQHFAFNKTVFENDYTLITDDLLIPVDRNKPRMRAAFKRLFAREGFVRLRYGDDLNDVAVGRVYGRYFEAGNNYMDLGIVPQCNMSKPVPAAMAKKRDVVLSRRRKLKGGSFCLDSVVSYPIKDKCSIDAILLGRKSVKMREEAEKETSLDGLGLENL